MIREEPRRPEANSSDREPYPSEQVVVVRLVEIGPDSPIMQDESHTALEWAEMSGPGRPQQKA